jgi:excisionase family DNA binding protein
VTYPQTSPEIRQLLSLPKVCGILGLQKTALYGIMERGELPFVVVTGRRRMIQPDDLDEFIRTRRTGGWNRK